MPVPLWVPAAITAAAGIFGAERSNRQNRQEAGKNRQFQAAEAERNRQFQERMRNTQWQAAVADAMAAGIHPMALTSGAAVPGGSMGSGSQAAPQQNTVAAGMDMIRARKELQLMTESIAKTKAEGRSAKAEADIVEERAKMLLRGRLGEDQRGPPLLRRQVEAEVRRMMSEAARTEGLAQITGVGGQVSQAFAEMLPALRILTKMSGKGSRDMAELIRKLGSN